MVAWLSALSPVFAVAPTAGALALVTAVVLAVLLSSFRTTRSASWALLASGLFLLLAVFLTSARSWDLLLLFGASLSAHFLGVGGGIGLGLCRRKLPADVEALLRTAHQRIDGPPVNMQAREDAVKAVHESVLDVLRATQLGREHVTIFSQGVGVATLSRVEGIVFALEKATLQIDDPAISSTAIADAQAFTQIQQIRISRVAHARQSLSQSTGILLTAIVHYQQLTTLFLAGLAIVVSLIALALQVAAFATGARVT